MKIDKNGGFNRIKTLCLDDSAAIRAVLILAFASMARFEARVKAASRDAYLEAMSASLKGAPYDLFILDLEGPSQNGAELLEQLRRLPGYRRTPVFFLWSAADPTLIERARLEGGQLIAKNNVAELYEELKTIEDRIDPPRAEPAFACSYRESAAKC